MRRITNCQIVGMMVALAVVVGTATSSNAALITGVTASADSEASATNTPASKTTDESGLNTGTGEHSTGNKLGWFSNNTAGLAGTHWIQWDLGALYTLSSIQVWNMNQSTAYTYEGINQVDIYTSSVLAPGDPEGAGAANWTLLKADAVFSEATGANDYTGFDLATEIGTALPGTDVQWVRFEIDTTFYNGTQAQADRTGMAEIQFKGVEASPVPEPSAIVLTVMGLIGICLCRRRRRS